MHDPRLARRRPCREREDLVPGQHVVAGDVERLADRPGVAEQRTKPLAKSTWCVSVHSDVPSPWTMTSMPGRIRSICVQPPWIGTAGAVVGVRRAHDRRREACPRGRRDSSVLAGDLVPGVLPVRVAAAASIRSPAPAGRRLIRRGGADEDILAGPTAEKVQIGLYVLGGVGHPVHDHVELPIAQRLPHRGAVADVAAEESPRRHPVGDRGGAPIEHGTGRWPRSHRQRPQAELMIPLPPMKRTRSPLTAGT